MGMPAAAGIEVIRPQQYPVKVRHLDAIDEDMAGEKVTNSESEGKNNFCQIRMRWLSLSGLCGCSSVDYPMQNLFMMWRTEGKLMMVREEGETSSMAEGLASHD
jgi:hypothetical protein